MKTFDRHLAAVRSCIIDKSNIIGIRRMISQSERKARGWSIGSTACVVPLDDLDTLESEIARMHPTARGELHKGGVSVLTNPRYKKRLENVRHIVDTVSRFDLLRFERIGNHGQNCVPVWRAINRDGQSFVFRHIPWQSGGNGPEILED